MGTAVDTVIKLMASKMAELVPELVEANLDKLSRVEAIKVGKAPAVKVDVAHQMLPTVLTAVVAGAAPFIVGPAGSGKTTLAEQIAAALKLKFYMEARVTSEFKLLGFIDAAGHVVRTQFRDAYEKGGVFLFDEVDASDADAMTAFNAALANGHCAFPDKLVKRHKDFHAIAAGNTFGRGADRQYVGRNQLDAATLDRFVVMEVDYDEQLEKQIAGDAEWVKRVQAVRAAVTVEKVRHIVSPRASIMGAKMLAAGMERSVVEEACIWKGLDAGNRARVASRMGETYNAGA
jgi:MoxR-like ATPase